MTCSNSRSLSPEYPIKTSFSPSADHDGEYPYSGPICSWAPPSGAILKMPEAPCLKLSLLNAMSPSCPGKAASAYSAASISAVTANINAATSAPRTFRSSVVNTLSAFRKGDGEEEKSTDSSQVPNPSPSTGMTRAS